MRSTGVAVLADLREREPLARQVLGVARAFVVVVVLVVGRVLLVVVIVARHDASLARCSLGASVLGPVRGQHLGVVDPMRAER